MRLTKKLEKEILKLYHQYWDSYLNGDMQTFASLLDDDDCHIIGSTEFDVFNNKKDAVNFYSSTAEQITGKADFRNRKITLLPNDANVMVEELSDFYFLAEDEWHFYSHCRLSTLFSKKETGWKIIYQHGSMPDSRAEQGEQIAAEKIANENKQLRDAIKRRTAELEYKNHELEIEASLERIRAVAMGMMKADDLLDICKIQFNEFRQLGFTDIRNALIGIFDDEQNYLIDYDYSDFAGGTINKIPYNKNSLIDRALKQMKSATDAFTEFIVEGKELEEWKAFRKQNGEYDDTRITDADVLYYYFYSINQGNVGISSFRKIKQEQLYILKKFRNVFDLAYKRYVDITNAEAQAREAKIEAALERVRSNTMAMHHSEELKEVISVTFEQLKSLNIIIDSCVITLFIEGSDDLNNWVASAEQKYPQKIRVPYFKHPLFDKIVLAKNKPGSYFTLHLSQKENQTFYKHVLENSDFGKIINEDRRKLVMNADSNIMSFANFQHAGLRMGNFRNHTYTHEENNTILRFAAVFEQTYTRFLDLQKAEAQAREAKIEAALERTRTQSMIMQHSKELDDTLRVFHEQVLLLGIPSAFSFLWLPDEDKDRHIFWAAWAENNSRVYKSKAINYPLDRNEPATAQCLVDWKSNQPVISYHVPPAGVESYFAAWQELIAGVEQLKAEYFGDGLYYVEAFMKYGCFGVMVVANLTEDEKKILGRFSIEFERTYTRFLDLQKAEAQARESQIQLALERVRARTMAMQKSEELSETAYILYQQFKELGKDPVQITIGIVNETQKVIELSLTKEGDQMDQLFKAPIDEPIVMHKIYVAWKEQKKSLVIDISGQQLREYNNFRNSLSDIEFNNDIIEDRRVINIAFFSKGLISVSYTEPAPPETAQLLERFAKVFEQTYTRFLDLQNAETQAKESKIEAALERVRSRTMGMQKSEELKEVIQLVYEQFIHLNIYIEHTGFLIDYKVRDDLHIWLADQHLVPSEVTIPCFDSPPNNSIKEAKEKGQDFFTYHLTFEEKNKFYRDLFRFIPGVPEETLEYYLNCPGLAGSGVLLDNIGLYIENFSGTPYSDEENTTLMRFGKVFQQTYTRFLDLQRAETQSRESQIQLALERVRARTMAMQHSNELPDAANILFQQMQTLGMPAWSAGYCIWDDDHQAITLWMSSAGIIQKPFRAPVTDDPCFIHFYDAWRRAETFYVEEIGGDAIISHYQYMLQLPVVGEMLKQFIADGGSLPTFQIFHLAFFSQGFLLFITYEPVPESHDIFKRFGNVFDQTYTRFLDLQKAEAQAREAQIELSLERVRAKTMAMHNSADVGKTAAVMVEELKKLGIETIRFGIGIMHEPGDMEVWTISTDENKTEIIIGWLDMNIHPLLHSAFESWRNKNESHSYELKGDDLLNYFNAINNYPGYPIKYDIASLPRQIHQYEFYFPEGILFAFSLQQLGEEQRKIFKRFAGVFGQTYRRYLDLKKAEAQAREAQIEAALERVRSRTMAMQNSDELAELVATVFTELNRLEFALTSCIIWINNPESLTAEMWVASTELNKPPEPYYIKPFRHPYFKSVIDAFKEKNKNWVYEMKGEEKKVFQEQFFNEVGSFPTLIKKALEAPESVVYSASFYNFGALEIVGNEHLTDEKFEILHRLGKVFDMSYTRFNDLKQAEAQAKEARIEAALERVRSRTLAMQKSDELAETAAVLFRQLIDLGIAPNRLYIGIINDDTGDIEAWATDEEGGKVNSRFTLSSSRNASIKKMYDGWKLREKSITIDMEGEELADYIAYISGEIHVPVTVGHTQQRRVQNIAYFGKGLIGIASPDPQPLETIQLIERFAAVFNLTYTRFNDLKVAEAHAIQAEEDLIKLQTEKKRAEDALTELRSTQAQLIQSEKMASLGELTAGIAHEIQNPLNFVNNFSEVNTELIAEMKEEIDKGNIEEVRAIANDISDNEQKINHHGKRADAIVKGMLQHSRSSTGVKEPTDINALADEYLRLAYHGLRAKDKDFNATMKVDFDEGIGKINIIPQDFGRVLLNLYTNAFYAANEKKKRGGGDYEPTVTVSTKRIDSKIELTVKDNGNGISQKIIDKIFQPFFTTKPTGEGTGLGLSLSYDIIKAHGGEIKVETNEGEGSEFIIKLPIT